MDNSDRISVVALVVSLVALIVTLLQALQQYFATAEGYRNCAASIIGPWHKTRRRRFVPSEFRFETIFEAPLILLTSPKELEIHQDRYGQSKVHMLYPSDRLGTASELLRETVHPSKRKYVNWYMRWIGGFSKNTHCLDEDRERSMKPQELKAETEHGLMADENALVSWIFFLRELHRTYQQYRPQYRTECEAVPNPDAKSKERAINNTKITPEDTAVQSDPVIIQKKMSWDFLGSEITRPVAMTTVGDIIALALRMGMQWRTIEPQNSKLQAVGNGYSLASMPLSRGGLMLTFTVASVHSKFPRIIPSIPANKLLFGILPGDLNLVRRDFHITNLGPDGRRKDTLAILSEIHTAMGTDSAFREGDLDLGYKFISTDFKKLLCPFLPLERSTIATVRFAGWPRHRAFSLLHFWESRLALLQELDEEVKRRAVLDDMSDPALWLLRHIKEQFDTLRHNYHDDFYCLKFTPSRETKGSVVEDRKKLEFLDACRGLAGICTRALAESNWGQFASEPGSGNVPTRYMLLAAAHSYIAKRAIEAGDKEFEIAEARLKETNGRNVSRREWAVFIGQVPEPDSPTAANSLVPPGSPKFWFRMKRIVREMENPENGIRQELLQRFGLDADKGEGETNEKPGRDPRVAWWLMMVRGVAWDMSCYREPWPEDWKPVRPEFYGDVTPAMLA